MSDACGRLHALFGRLPVFSFPYQEKDIPINGIYILFEGGERAHDGGRVVRVGTHTGNNQLRSRLKQHFLYENKDRSIFRKNIGRALLNKSRDPFLEQWELDLTTREARRKYEASIDISKQASIEMQVTSYIQERFNFVVIAMDGKESRLAMEARIISTISLCQECNPSGAWLGNWSPKSKIRESGLWLVNELYGIALSESELLGLESLISSGEGKIGT
ncbi:MAG: hypothetical protein Q8Q28_11805 [Pseudomonadota bacterium]|nr:hypothetical protein [Pseudomonadota bacterium]